MQIRENKRHVTWRFMPEKKKQKFTPKSCLFSESPKELNRRTGRRRKGLMKKLYSTKKRPLWFVTLSYPKEMAEILSLDEITDHRKKLGQRIRDIFPNGWFIYSIEHSNKGGFHFHLLGRTGEKKSPIRKWFRRWWLNYTGSDAKNLVHVRKLADEEQADLRCGYLTKRAKFNGHRKVTKFFGNRNSFGIFNRNNHKKAAVEDYHIDADKFYKVRDILEDDHLIGCKESGTKNDRHHEQIVTSGSGSHILQNKKKSKELRRTLRKLDKKED